MQKWFGLGEHSQSYNYSSASVQTTWRRWSGPNALSLIKDMVTEVQCTLCDYRKTGCTYIYHLG